MRRRRRGRARVTRMGLLMVTSCVCLCEGDRQRDGEAVVGLEVIRICGRASLNTLGMTVTAHTLLAIR